jgi:hypothetical protein
MSLLQEVTNTTYRKMLIIAEFEISKTIEKAIEIQN